MTEKKIVFLDNDEQHARMIVRLRYDRLTQGNFFRGLVKLYVDNDLDMARVIEKIKLEKSLITQDTMHRIEILVSCQPFIGHIKLSGS